MNAASAKKDFASAQLELFAIRCSELAERVVAGNIAFINAVDMAYSAAEWAGLIDAVGDDAVQKVMAAAFINTPRGRDEAP